MITTNNHKYLRIFEDFTLFSEKVFKVYNEAIVNYHLCDNFDQPLKNPYDLAEPESLFYNKCWIDTVQWHIEDEIRRPDINEFYALQLKRRIDKLNQERTNIVEVIDDFFFRLFSTVPLIGDAKINSETPAWALDRLSILALKIFHMSIEHHRTDVTDDHRVQCKNKLNVLTDQYYDLSNSINELLSDIAQGRKKIKLYKQMKMYNDPNLNPVLYKKSSNTTV